MQNTRPTDQYEDADVSPPSTGHPRRPPRGRQARAAGRQTRSRTARDAHTGGLNLAPNGYGWASGGYIADSKIDGTVGPYS
ncbi:hypothetical protein ABT270_28200, partial [Streptomyces sp900105245]|uniref:hypothetical protein n=1 Tax=Streptomyces sp. 900105245 TaxID=3154379 RepID=UPI00331C2412